MRNRSDKFKNIHLLFWETLKFSMDLNRKKKKNNLKLCNICWDVVLLNKYKMKPTADLLSPSIYQERKKGVTQGFFSCGFLQSLFKLKAAARLYSLNSCKPNPFFPRPSWQETASLCRLSVDAWISCQLMCSCKVEGLADQSEWKLLFKMWKWDNLVLS